LSACSQPVTEINTVKKKANHNVTDTAYFGAGCFWCVEAIFESINGVENVTSGYSGGQSNNPTYEEVCKGNTGHAETVMIEYDANTVNKLLDTRQYSIITTDVEPLTIFYPAEIYHQDYEKNNPYNPYVERVSKPRLNSFKKRYNYLLKEDK